MRVDALGAACGAVWAVRLASSLVFVVIVVVLLLLLLLLCCFLMCWVVIESKNNETQQSLRVKMARQHVTHHTAFPRIPE